MKSRLLIDFRVLEFLAPLRKREREFLMQRFEAIRDSPDQYIDFRHRDETGRDLAGHITDRFAIEFWDDFADRHVKIMGVTWADKVR